MTVRGRLGLAGEVSAKATYIGLKDDPRAILVDVRTKPEWQFVGVPDLRDIPKVVLFCEWKTYPTMQTNADFVEHVSEALRAGGAAEDTPIYFSVPFGIPFA